MARRQGRLGSDFSEMFGDPFLVPHYLKPRAD
jgi:hypothetical protein